MKNEDDIMDSMNTWRKELIDNLVEDNATAVGVSRAGVAAVIGGAVAVGVGLTGVAVPAIALGAAYVAWKKNEGFTRHSMRKLFERFKED